MRLYLETTSNTLAFALWELAKDQLTQNLIRTEILLFMKRNQSETIPVSQFEEMECTTSFIKVCLLVVHILVMRHEMNRLTFI